MRLFVDREGWLERGLVAAWVLGAALAAPSPCAAGALDALDESLSRAFGELGPSVVPSGVLLDRVLPIAGLERYDGTSRAPEVSAAALRQIVHELRRSTFASGAVPRPDADELRARAQQVRDGAPIPIAVVDARAHRLREGALLGEGGKIAPGRVEIEAGDLEEIRVFAAAPLVHETRRGGEVRFVLPADLRMSWGRPAPSSLSIDFDDGRGFRRVRESETLSPSWPHRGRRTVALRAEWPDGDVRTARFPFDVIRMGTPAPDDTLTIQATVPFEGIAGSGRAYVALAPGHGTIVNPAIVIEGFDLDDTMSWERLYELLNQENLLEDLRAQGFDAVVLDFDSATAPIQRNAFVVAELLQQIAASIDPSQSVFLVGASMGGLCARYALTWMESQSIDARVRTFLSFDAPHGGANLPLGVQYWLDFFSGQSTDAAFLLSRLDTPAARQMLLAHHTTPPGPTGVPDPLRGTFLADQAALGNWPAAPRLSAVANGSGAGLDQGFAPSAQIIRWEYRSFLVDIDGNVWAVPNGSSTMILQGRIEFVFLPPDIQNVVVSGTSPWDNAPGGSRDSMFQMDTTAAPFGDIVALHDRHCFVPTVSALALDTSDLFFDVDGTANLLDLVPFDAIRWAGENESHVFVSPETKAWIMAEAASGATGVPTALLPPPQPALLQIHAAAPNPFRDRVLVRFALETAAPVSADIVDISGRRVARLLDHVPLSGRHPFDPVDVHRCRNLFRAPPCGSGRSGGEDHRNRMRRRIATII